MPELGEFPVAEVECRSEEVVGADYWETAQGMAITMATIGLVYHVQDRGGLSCSNACDGSSRNDCDLGNFMVYMDSKSSALADYSLAYTICGLVTFALMPTYAQVISTRGPVIMIFYALGIAVVSLAAVVLMGKRKKA